MSIAHNAWKRVRRAASRRRRRWVDDDDDTSQSSLHLPVDSATESNEKIYTSSSDAGAHTHNLPLNAMAMSSSSSSCSSDASVSCDCETCARVDKALTERAGNHDHLYVACTTMEVMYPLHVTEDDERDMCTSMCHANILTKEGKCLVFLKNMSNHLCAHMRMGYCSDIQSDVSSVKLHFRQAKWRRLDAEVFYWKTKIGNNEDPFMKMKVYVTCPPSTARSSSTSSPRQGSGIGARPWPKIVVTKLSYRALREYSYAKKMMNMAEHGGSSDNVRAFHIKEYQAQALPFMCLPLAVVGDDVEKHDDERQSVKGVVYDFALYGDIMTYLCIVAWKQHHYCNKDLSKESSGASSSRAVMAKDINGSRLQKTVESLRSTWMEIMICQATWQLLHVLRFMHSLGWAHRDVKPDNVYVVDSNYHYLWCDGERNFEHERPYIWIKIGDFEFMADDTRVMTEMNRPGSVHYSPREAFYNVHTEEASTYNAMSADIWCLGVFVYTMLSGMSVCNSGRLVDAAKDDPMFPYRARAFVNDCCRTCPGERPIAQELFDHEWFAKHRKYLVEYSTPSSFSSAGGMNHMAAYAKTRYALQQKHAE